MNLYHGRLDGILNKTMVDDFDKQWDYAVKMKEDMMSVLGLVVFCCEFIRNMSGETTPTQIDEEECSV